MAFQDPENTNLVYISKLLDIPVSTLFKDIKKLQELNFIKPYLTEATLVDARNKFYSITYEGLVFLNFLKDTLSLTLNKMKDFN